MTRFAILLCVLLALCVNAVPQLSFDVASIEESDMDQVLIGTVILKHRWLVRNSTMTLPSNPNERAQHLNETHYFGPAVTEPVRYRDGMFGGYIVLESTSPDQAVVAIQDAINRLEGIDLVITGENAGHWTGNEGTDFWTRDIGNGAAATFEGELAIVLAIICVTALVPLCSP